MTNDWKARLGMVYSTDPNFKYDTEEAPQTETLAPERQDLRVWLDRKQRGGKTVTLVKGFVGSDTDLGELARLLKTRCGVGGAAKYGSIKGRVFMYIPVAGFLVTLLLLSKMPAIGNSIISSVESSPILPVLIVFFSIVAMYAVSIILSIRIMKKKEM